MEPQDTEELPPDPKEAPQEDTVEAHFLTEPVQSYRYRHCGADFQSNNQLHKHIQTSCSKSKTPKTPTVTEENQSEKPEPVSAFHASKVVWSSATDVPAEGYAFCEHRFVTAVVLFILTGQGYKLCFDTGCTMSLIDRKFLLEVFPGVVLKKMATPMTMRGIGLNMHDASEYVRLQMYLPGKNGHGTALIEREFHVVDNLTAKALVGIDIIKPEGIVIDPAKGLMTVCSCKNLEVAITSSSQRPQTKATVFSNKRMSIPLHSNVAVPVAGLKRRQLSLPDDRDLIFEPHKLEALSVYAHIVDHQMTNVFVRNDTDHTVTLPAKARLGMITDYKAAGCFAVDALNHDLATRAPKRSPSWIKTGLQKLVAATAAFSAAIGPAITEKTHSTGVTIHGPQEAQDSIAAVVTKFLTLWQDTGGVKNVPQSEWMDIPLLENWRDLYKPGQARVYPLGQRDKNVIDKEFDKMHEQDRME